MYTFLQNSLTFPTVVYSGLLVIVLVYWLTAIMGIVDIDLLEGDADGIADSTTDAGGWLHKFKLNGIPLTVSISFVILVSWVVCFLGVHWIYPMIDSEWIQIAIGFWLLVLTPFISIEIIAPLLKPLKSLFHKEPERTAQDLLGHYVTVRTNKVTPQFGEGEYHDGGAGLILKIRAPEPNSIQRGAKVRLSRYDATTNTYQVTAPDQ